MHIKGLSLLPFALLGLAALSAASPQPGDDDGVVGPGPAPMDPFHPAKDTPSAPRYGGRVIVHIASLPESICYPVENSAVTRRLLYECHEYLLLQDWEYHTYTPKAAESFVTEDVVVLTNDAAAAWIDKGAVEILLKRQGEIKEGQSVHEKRTGIYGKVAETEGGYRVTPISKGSALTETVVVPAAAVERIELGSVFTFNLRPNMYWHPSVVLEKTNRAAYNRLKRHTLDANDVLFSWQIYSNPHVKCDEKRFQFEKTTGAELVDDMTIRFFYEGQYAFATHSLGVNLSLLPQHLYDLSDPDNPDHKDHFTAEEQGKHINENPHNQLWVGLGPYRVTQWDQTQVQAERFTDDDGKALYWNKEDAGYVDTIRWRYIDNDESAINAVMNNELDFFERVKPEDYFGGRADKPEFQKNHYKGYKYLGIYGYTGMNMYKPQLKDLAVRKAIVHAFDFEAYRISNYKGLARQTTGPFPFNSAGYNHDVEPLEYDVDLAIEMLEDAGWYDRNNNGIADKDGVELELDFLMPSGNDASRKNGLAIQDALSELNIKINIVQMEWATFLEKLKTRQFDLANLAWVPELESDPEQLWHSKWGEYDKESSNNSGVMDPKVDELIARGQRELDFEARQKIWHEMHDHIYNNIMPYMFMYNVPQKYAMSKRLRGFQAVAVDPGYIIRRWYFHSPSEPGTRT
ncbi:MAG: ABC transporter substrate-binding protein, partial [Planctomycetota bacterium]|nr:ABC transporter substrate-binding protein [Planctomycetota bacterium]